MNVNWPPGPDRPDASSQAVHVWRAELDRWRSSSLHALAPSERERAAAIRHPSARDRWAASRRALREVLARYLDADPVAIELRVSERGKPALADPAATLHFNLSHCGPLALIAVAEGREVGVDIEKIDAERDVIALADRGLDPAVAATIRAAAPAEQITTFYEAWARREATVKCLGIGLGAPLRQDRVTLSPLDAGPDYAAALALAGSGPIPHLRFSLSPA
jgi:4'-phosphopantetheinyl transferase